MPENEKCWACEQVERYSPGSVPRSALGEVAEQDIGLCNRQLDICLRADADSVTLTRVREALREVSEPGRPFARSVDRLILAARDLVAEHERVLDDADNLASVLRMANNTTRRRGEQRDEWKARAEAAEARLSAPRSDAEARAAAWAFSKAFRARTGTPHMVNIEDARAALDAADKVRATTNREVRG